MDHPIYITSNNQIHSDGPYKVVYNRVRRSLPYHGIARRKLADLKSLAEKPIVFNHEMVKNVLFLMQNCGLVR